MAPSSGEVQRTLMGPPWASSSTLGGATLMAHAKFEVIAKLIMGTRKNRHYFSEPPWVGKPRDPGHRPSEAKGARYANRK